MLQRKDWPLVADAARAVAAGELGQEYGDELIALGDLVADALQGGATRREASEAAFTPESVGRRRRRQPAASPDESVPPLPLAAASGEL